MKKNSFVLLLAFLILLLGQPAKADKLFQMGKGFEIKLSDEWEQQRNTLTNGSEDIIYALYDMSALGVDLDSVDYTSFVKELLESLEFKAENYRTYDPLNGFHTTIMDVEMPMGITIKAQGAALVKHSYICIILYYSVNADDILTEDDIIDLVYCISFNESNDSIMESSSNIQTENGVLLAKTPLLVELDEDEYNYVYLGMSEDSKTLKRISYSNDQIKEILTFGESTDMIIWRIGTDGLVQNRAPNVKIRIKENRVQDNIDIRNVDQAEQKSIWDELVSDFRPDGKYMTETINGIPYASFTFPMGFQKRYMTIISGDLIYVYLESPDELTEDDLDFLHAVLESITAPEAPPDSTQKVEVTVDGILFTVHVPDTYSIYTSALGKTGIYGDLDTEKMDAYLQQLGSCMYGEHTERGHQLWVNITDRSPGLGKNPSKEMIDSYYDGMVSGRGQYTKENYEGQNYYLFADGKSIYPNGINYRIATFLGYYEISIRWESGTGTRTAVDIAELKNMIRSVEIQKDESDSISTESLDKLAQMLEENGSSKPDVETDQQTATGQDDGWYSIPQRQSKPELISVKWSEEERKVVVQFRKNGIPGRYELWHCFDKKTEGNISGGGYSIDEDMGEDIIEIHQGMLDAIPGETLSIWIRAFQEDGTDIESNTLELQIPINDTVSPITIFSCSVADLNLSALENLYDQVAKVYYSEGYDAFKKAEAKYYKTAVRSKFVSSDSVTVLVISPDGMKEAFHASGTPDIQEGDYNYFNDNLAYVFAFRRIPLEEGQYTLKIFDDRERCLIGCWHFNVIGSVPTDTD